MLLVAKGPDMNMDMCVTLSPTEVCMGGPSSL